VLTFFT